MDDVSPSTRLGIHADEERALRWTTLKRFPLFVLATLLWIADGGRLDNPLFFLVGLSALPVGAAAIAWRRHRRLDPLAYRPNRVEARDAAIAEQTLIAERVAARGSYVTYALVGLLVVVGVLQLALDGSIARSVAAAGLVKPAVKAGQWWRLVSATYLHGSWFHIWGNLGALLVLGKFVEAYSPRWRMPVVYAAAGITGSIASFLLLGKTSVGASGAIMGLAGYLAVMSRLSSGTLPKSVRTSVFTTIGLAAYVGAFGFSFIDNAAHFGGLAAGALVAWLTIRREDEEPRQPQWNLIGAIAAVLIIVGAGGTVAALARVRPRAVWSADATVSSARSMMITNNSSRPIEAYRVSVRQDGRVLKVFWRDDCCFAGNGAQTPIAPHESRALGAMPTVIGVSIGPPAPHLDVVIFDDGSYEGDPDQYEQLIAQRRWAAEAADYWTTALKEDQWLPATTFATSVTKRLESRLKQNPLEYAAATALGIPALVADVTSSSQQVQIAETLAAIAAAQKALRARLGPTPPA